MVSESRLQALMFPFAGEYAWGDANHESSLSIVPYVNDD